MYVFRNIVRAIAAINIGRVGTKRSLQRVIIAGMASRRATASTRRVVLLA